MSKHTHSWMALLALGLPPLLPAATVFTNGEFTGNLDSWTVSGTVFNTGDAAVFSDSVASPTSIFQSAAIPASLISTQLSFDFLNGLSALIAPGFFPDSFYATLYLGSGNFGPSLIGANYDQIIPLFDLDAVGPFNIAAGGTFGPSPKGAGWTRFSLDYDFLSGFTGPGFATLAFEFYNLNGTASDSVAAVDNVSMIVVVPEPGPSLLLSLSAAALLLRRKRLSRFSAL